MNHSKILILSRNGIVRHGLRLILGAALPFDVTADDWSCDHLGSVLDRHWADLVVLDADSHDLESLEQFCSAFLRHQPQPRLVVLCDADRGAQRTRTLACLAATLIAPDGDTMSLLAEINRQLSQEPMACTEAAPPLPASQPGAPCAVTASPRGDGRNAARITPREQQVIELIQQGYCNKRIAKALNIGFTTVRSHRQSVMEKLGLRNAVEIARFVSGLQAGTPSRA